MKYEPKNIEKKWQKVWEESGIYKNYTRDKKFYTLDMFPYPSGAGLHVGHPKGYIATDVISRFKLLNGYSVLHPMGWDAFGLPAENYAIKNKVHPRIAVEENIATFKKQLEAFGFTYDWDREINTTDPEYYKWTQWIFLKLFEKGLAYESNEPVNWCPSCKTVLSNEDLENGLCERCGSEVEQKPMRQWVLKMTAYADRLLYDLDSPELDWEDSITDQQRNWIGRSEGVTIKFPISNSQEFIEVFTTRVDTIFGCTYCVVAPEHPVIENLKSQILNLKEVEDYVLSANKKTNLERAELQKEKTGIRLEGVEVINPFTQKAVPLFVADYVLGNYGTGAVMAVPAHDERDFEFAKKYDLAIKPAIAVDDALNDQTRKIFEVAKEIAIFAKENKLVAAFDGGIGLDIAMGMITRNHGDIDLQVEKEKLEVWEKYFEDKGFVIKKNPDERFELYVAELESLHIDFGCYIDDVEKLIKNTIENIEFTTFNPIEILKYKKSEAERTKSKRLKDIHDYALFGEGSFVEDGYLINSEKYSGLSSQEAREKMADWLEKEGIGKRKVNYKMRDWVYSRQRYWGEPIPIIHCEKCGAVGVPESDLPVVLPEVENYEPTGTGESPLANIAEWVNTTCPKCGGAGKRETNTMPQWGGSSWYYLRYIDPKNNGALVGKELEKEWMPVDLYVGGAEHATRHLLYARFWHKFLFDIGAVSTIEPFKKLVHVGLIMAEDGRKMSKRWNNVINPDDVIDEFGADAMRLYEMFMGPFTQSVAWSTSGVSGVRRFLEKVYGLRKKVQIQSADNICGAGIFIEVGNGSYLFHERDQFAKIAPGSVAFWGGGREKNETPSQCAIRELNEELGIDVQENDLETIADMTSKNYVDGEFDRFFNLHTYLDINNITVKEGKGYVVMSLGEAVNNPKIDTRTKTLLEIISKGKKNKSLLHKTIKKVTSDIENFRFNTAISQMMILVNAMEKEEKILVADYELLVTILAPFAPHMAEEIWEKLGHEQSIFLQSWPQHDLELMKESEIEIVVQVNGKVRERLMVAADVTEDEIKETALESEKVKVFTEGKEIRKIIFVPEKLINIVI
ncbi:MAG: class I tRNA ligase family protein [Candidatus Moranbacteria bacterium]|nr:class I tRNA ligase family protein [Candidatus Moranbacteria bacterium]